MAPLRVLELYSGIGGMHQALKGTGERPPRWASLGARCRRTPPCAPVSSAPSFRWDPTPRGEALEGAVFSMRGLRRLLSDRGPLPSPVCRFSPAVLHKHRVEGSCRMGGWARARRHKLPLQGQGSDLMVVGLVLPHRPAAGCCVEASCKWDV